MKKYWVRNRRKRFYGEMWENAVRGGGTCKNPVRLSTQDGPMETVEYMWVNIQCMLIALAKIPEYQRASHDTAFIGNCWLISHTFYSPI